MTTIHCGAIPESRRAAFTGKLFGLDFPLRLEPAIFNIAGQLSRQYAGGFWEFYGLCNGGFYMAPTFPAVLAVRCENGFEGELSSDAFGVTSCLYAYSQLSFGGDPFAETCGEHYHRLREFALGHRDAGAIFSAID